MLALDGSTALVDYLTSKGVVTYRASGNEVTAACWWCNDGNPHKRKLYLNTDTWFYDCKVCGEHGNRKTLLRYYGDDERDEMKYAPGTDPVLRSKALREGIALAEDLLYNNQGVLDYLQGRGLSLETIVDARLGYVPSSWGLGSSLVATNDRRDVMAAGWLNKDGQEFFSGHIIIPYFSHGSVVQVRGKEYWPASTQTRADGFVMNKLEHSGKYVSTKGDDVRLYNADSLAGAREVLIVEGEFDARAVEQCFRESGDEKLQNIAVVGLAGAMTMPVGFERMFDTAARIYTGVDPDDTGDRAVEKIKALLGDTKVREIKLPRSLPKCDWSDYLGPKTDKNPHGDHAATDVLNLIHDAEASGRVLFTVADAQRERDKLHRERGQGMSFGLGDIDRYIHPGAKPGQLVVPLAKTGVGKTAMLATLTYNLTAAGRSGLVLSLELTAVEYYDRLARAARFYNPLITDKQIREMFRNLRIYESTLGPKDTMRLVEEYIADVGHPPEWVGVDYLGYASRRWPGQGQYEKVSNTVMSLKEDAKAGKFVMIAPHQVGRGNKEGEPITISDARDSGVIEETADILFGWYRPGDAGRKQEDGLVTCRILKNRNGRRDVDVHFTFSLASLVLVPRASVAATIAADENRMVLTGSTYDQVLEGRRKQALSTGQAQGAVLPGLPNPSVDRSSAFSH